MYKVYDSIMLRVPLGSVCEYLKIDRCNTPTELVKQYLDYLPLKRAIAIASPRFYEFIESEEKKTTEPNYKFIDTMLKYISRAFTRATPYGTFAGVTFGQFETETYFNVNEDTDFQVLVEVDRGWLFDVVRLLEDDDVVLSDLRVIFNQNVYQIQERLKNPYISFPEQGATHSNIKYGRQIEKVYYESQKPILVKNLVDTIYRQNDGQVSMDKIYYFIKSLVKNEYLLTELRFSRVFDETIGVILGIIPQSCKRYAELLDISALIDELNRTKDIKMWIARYTSLCRKMSETNQSDNYLSVIQAAPQFGFGLGPQVKSDLEDLTEFLKIIANEDNETPSVKYWKKRFIKDFGSYVEVPFIELFDDVTGFGDPYSKKQAPNIKSSDTSSKFKAVRKLVEDKIIHALISGKREIEITDIDIEELRKISKPSLPFSPSFELGITIRASSKYNIDKNQYYISIFENIGACQAGIHSARFTPIFEEAQREKNSNMYNLLLNKTSPSYDIVNIKELPRNGRVANISSKQSNIKKTLTFGLYDECGESVLIEEVLVGYDRQSDRLYLKSKRTNRILKFVSDSALNTMATNHIARCLREISSAYETSALSGISCIRSNFFPFTPRIRYKNVIIQDERWRLKATDFIKPIEETFYERFKEMKNSIGFGRYIYLCDMDRRVLVDTENEYWINFLMRQVKKSKEIILENCEIDLQEAWTKDFKREVYLPEIVVSFIEQDFTNDLYLRVANKHYINSISANSVLVGQEDYFYIKIYLDNELCDKFLVEQLLPFLEQNEALIAKFFFIRYSDPDFHIRLRIKVKKTNSFIRMANTVIEWINGLYQNRWVKYYEIVPYLRETERYGGINLIPHAEDLFCQDSWFVLRLLKYIGIDNTEQRELMGAYLVAISLIDLVGKKDLKEFINKAFFYPQLKKEYRQKKDAILTLLFNEDNFSDERMELSLKNRRNAYQDFREKLILENELTNSIKDIVYSLIHMTCNRMNGNTYFEQKVTSFGSHALDSWLYFQSINQNK